MPHEPGHEDNLFDNLRKRAAEIEEEQRKRQEPTAKPTQDPVADALNTLRESNVREQPGPPHSQHRVSRNLRKSRDETCVSTWAARTTRRRRSHSRSSRCASRSSSTRRTRGRGSSRCGWRGSDRNPSRSQISPWPWGTGASRAGGVLSGESGWLTRPLLVSCAAC